MPRTSTRSSPSGRRLESYADSRSGPPPLHSGGKVRSTGNTFNEAMLEIGVERTGVSSRFRPSKETRVVYDREALIALIQETALEFGSFTLASGKQANFYLDCRKVTLDSAGANLIATGILELIGDDMPDAVGGMAIGADPITAAVITVAGLQGKHVKGFIVRKEAKGHGTGRAIEGPVRTGQRAVIVEDVVTTGGSSLRAIEQAEGFGLRVDGVIAVVDRLEGASQAIEQRGYSLRTLLTMRDLGIDA